MTRLALTLLVLAAAACSPPVPDSGSSREAELRGRNYTTVLPPVAPVASTPLDDLAAGAVDTGAATADAQIPTQPQPGLENPDISDEQDFGAVAERESIQSDAERLAAQREAYQVIEPTALPSRDAAAEPNVVEYALSSQNAVGSKVFRRSFLATGKRFLRNCGKYPSPDLAQEAFLRSGGPDRDRMGLDPDGDGFACSWDPTPFRQARATGG